LRAELARVVNPAHHESLLVAERALLRAFYNRVGHAARQRADAGVREKDFVARDGKFFPAQFLIGENFGQSHASRLNGGGSGRKGELTSNSKFRFNA
jgi:hypothetical protein